MTFYFYNEKCRWNEKGMNMLHLVEEYLNNKYNTRNFYKEYDGDEFISNILSLSFLVSNQEVINELIHTYCVKYDVEFSLDELVLIEIQVRDMVNGCVSSTVSANRLMYSSKLREKKNDLL